MTDEEIFTIKEVSSYLKLAGKTLYRLGSEGKLPRFKVVVHGDFVNPRLMLG